MRAPLSWIRDFTPVDAPVADVVSAFNQLGLEVEGVEQPGEEITGVIAAQVLEVVQHPNADKLVTTCTPRSSLSSMAGSRSRSRSMVMGWCRVASTGQPSRTRNS